MFNTIETWIIMAQLICMAVGMILIATWPRKKRGGKDGV